jgi:transglutaminase-like putative cysteine protease
MSNKKGKAARPQEKRPPEKASPKFRMDDWRGWLNLVLLFAVLEVAVLSLERAQWITPQPSLTLVLILSMLVVWALVVCRLHSIFIHILALIVGALVTIWQTNGFQSSNVYYFAVFLTSVTWLMGYLSTWFVLRRINAWVAVCAGALVLLVNLSNLPASYYIYFGFYFIAAIFLIVQTRVVKRQYSPEQSARYTGKGLVYFISSLLCIVVVAVGISWAMPDVRFPQLQTMIATKMLWKQNIEESKFNFFADIASKQSLNTNSMRLDLPFEATWHQGDRIDFIVTSAIPSYWQVRAYDIYTAAGWQNSPVTDVVLKSKHAWDSGEAPANSERVTYTVTPNIKTDVLLTSGSFIVTNKPVMIQVGSGDIIGILSSHVLSAGERYSVTAAVTQATPAELETASDNYSQINLENYLQLPADFPEGIRELSANLTANATTPYQKVLKINDYLARIPYSTNIKAPPEGVDGVAYFLFAQRAGFCVHYASAMAVMLRSVGVPARLAIGYLPGEPGAETGEYVLRDKSYHAWPQVYFPGYGWVDIEATPSSAESAGSAVELSGPVVSSDTIRELPQWDVWFNPALYGWNDVGGGRSSVPSAESIGGPRGPWVWASQLGQSLLIILIITFFTGLLIVPFLVLRSSFFRWVWKVDRSNLAAVTYERLCQLGAMLKLGPKPNQTPLEYAAVLANEFPEQASDINDITRAYLVRRFGRGEGKLDLFNEARILKARCRTFNKIMSRLTQIEKVFRGRL